MKIELIDIIEVGNTLGEGVLYDPRTDQLWWTDIHSCLMYRYDWADKQVNCFETPERLCSFGFTDTPGKFIAAFESGFAFYQPEAGKVDWIARPFRNIDGLRFNDGRVDRQGRFWCGSMAEDGLPETIAQSGLFYLHPDLTITNHIKGVEISNATCWNPDSKSFYFADTPSGNIRHYDFHAPSGELSNMRVFATTAKGTFPDGAVTDAEGYVWNAQWAGSKVVRYAPDGTEDLIVDLPVSQPTCPAFGGPDGDMLFVTTAQENMSPEKLAAEPHAGDVFVFKTETRGQDIAIFG
jgi:L-arabinonolactonase